MKLTTALIIGLAFTAGQFFAQWAYLDRSPVIATAMAAAPQCVTVEQAPVEQTAARPDIHQILAAMPLQIREMVTADAMPPLPRQKPNAALAEAGLL